MTTVMEKIVDDIKRLYSRTDYTTKNTYALWEEVNRLKKFSDEHDKDWDSASDTMEKLEKRIRDCETGIYHTDGC